MSGTIMTIAVMAVFLVCNLVCESLALCQAGEYNSANGNCHPCPEGTFMNRSDHTQTKCERCGCADVTGREDVTVLINCTRTNDAVCACVSGMFNVDIDQIVCQLCTRCTDVEVRKCSAHSDAVCQTDTPFISTEQQYSTENLEYVNFTTTSIPTLSDNSTIDDTDEENIDTPSKVMTPLIATVIVLVVTAVVGYVLLRKKIYQCIETIKNSRNVAGSDIRELDIFIEQI